MFFIVFVCKSFTLYIRQDKENTYWGLGLDALTFILHSILTCRDPGFVRNEGLEFMKLLETFDA